MEIQTRVVMNMKGVYITVDFLQSSIVTDVNVACQAQLPQGTGSLIQSPNFRTPPQPRGAGRLLTLHQQQP